jgi:uncharacterized repeat protein (TIGR01451 family)
MEAAKGMLRGRSHGFVAALSLSIAAIASVFPGLSYGQCTANAGTYLPGTVTANLCNFPNQLIQDCAGTPFVGSTPQAIYQVSIGESSNAVIELQAGSGFTPYMSLFSAASPCSDATSCGSYEAVGAFPGDSIALPVTTGLAAGTYYLLVGDLIDRSITCPSPNAQYTLSLASGSLSPTLQSLVTISKELTGNTGPISGQASPGAQLTYTITLNNAGGADATGFALSDGLPANTAFVSASNGGTLSDGSIDWTGLTIKAGAASVVSLTVQVADVLAPSVTQITNVAYPTGSATPACPSADPACVVTPVQPSSAVSVTSTLTGNTGPIPALASAGAQLTYTFTLSNSGNTDASNVSLLNAVPANTSFVSASSGGTLSGGIVTWSALTVPAGGSTAITLTVQVASPLTNGTTEILDVAYLAGTSPADCPSVDPSCVVVYTTSSSPNPGTADLKLTLSGPSTAPAGSIATFLLTMNNNGPAAADGATFTATLPIGVTGITATCTLASNDAVCPASLAALSGSGTSNPQVAGAIPTLPALSGVVVQVSYRIPLGSSSSVTTLASISPPSGVTDPDLSTNSNSVSTVISYAADIAVVAT